MGNRQKQIAQAKQESRTDAEFQAKLLTMLLSANDFTNENLVKFIAENARNSKQIFDTVKEIRGFAAAIKEKDLTSIVNIPDKVSLKEAIQIERPDWIDSLKVSTIELERRLDEITKAIKEKETPLQAVVVKNEVEVKEPKWYKPFDPTVAINKLIIGIKEGVRDVMKSVVLKVTSEAPLRVVITNGSGKAIDLKTIGAAGQSSGGGYAGGVTVEPKYFYIQVAEDATYKYYGYTDGTHWKIKRKTLASGIWQVAKGTGDYDTAFADRASKSYSYTV